MTDKTGLNPESEAAHEKLLALHQSLNPRIRDDGWDLYPHDLPRRIVEFKSVSYRDLVDVPVLAYTRSTAQACLIEGLMGRANCRTAEDINLRHHPAIELRLSPQHFVIELIVSPDAWWDQQNLVGKLSIGRHRQTLRELLNKMDDAYRFGFWEGVELSDMQIENWQLKRGDILNQWLGTFAERHDCLRVGIWMPPEQFTIESSDSASQVFRQMKALYELYRFVAWTGNNNYREFFKQKS